jgi:hypothetical protein
MWSSPPFVHQLISWWQNVFDICSCALPIWTMHDLLRNGLSYSLLWPEHTTQFPRNWTSSPALLCTTFVSLFIYFPLPIWAMHDLLRNGLSYSMLWPEHTTQFPRNWASSPALLCTTFISLFIYFPSPYWANSKDYKLPLCNSVCLVGDSELPRWNPMT